LLKFPTNLAFGRSSSFSARFQEVVCLDQLNLEIQNPNAEIRNIRGGNHERFRGRQGVAPAQTIEEATLKILAISEPSVTSVADRRVWGILKPRITRIKRMV